MWAQAVSAVTKWPTVREWRGIVVDVLLLAPVLAILALIGGFVGVAPSPAPAIILSIAVIAFFVPAFAEELVFRVFLLGPAPSVQRYMIAIGLFVAWHPLQIPIFGEEWRAVVLNPLFLGAVAVFGVVLSRVYVKTGSIWPPVLLQWIVVVAWKMAGGPSPWAP